MLGSLDCRQDVARGLAMQIRFENNVNTIVYNNNNNRHNLGLLFVVGLRACDVCMCLVGFEHVCCSWCGVMCVCVCVVLEGGTRQMKPVVVLVKGQGSLVRVPHWMDKVCDL